MTFVAFSRVKIFLVCPFTLERFTKISESASLAARLKEDNRLESLAKKTMRDFNFLLDEYNRIELINFYFICNFLLPIKNA